MCSIDEPNGGFPCDLLHVHVRRGARRAQLKHPTRDPLGSHPRDREAVPPRMNMDQALVGGDARDLLELQIAERYVARRARYRDEPTQSEVRTIVASPHFRDLHVL